MFGNIDHIYVILVRLGMRWGGSSQDLNHAPSAIHAKCPKPIRLE